MTQHKAPSHVLVFQKKQWQMNGSVDPMSVGGTKSKVVIPKSCLYGCLYSYNYSTLSCLVTRDVQIRVFGIQLPEFSRQNHLENSRSCIPKVLICTCLVVTALHKTMQLPQYSCGVVYLKFPPPVSNPIHRERLTKILENFGLL